MTVCDRGQWGGGGQSRVGITLGVHDWTLPDQSSLREAVGASQSQHVLISEQSLMLYKMTHVTVFGGVRI